MRSIAGSRVVEAEMRLIKVVDIVLRRILMFFLLLTSL